MKAKKEKQSLKEFARCVPELLRYYIFIWLISSFCFYFINTLSSKLLSLSNRVAITSGDFGFLFTSWQGWLIVILALVSILICVVIDINGVLILSDKLVKNEEVKTLQVFRQSIASLPRFFSKEGILYLFYLVLIAPIGGLGMLISITQDFYIPRFITSAILSKFIYKLAFGFVFLMIILFAIRHSFLLPYIVLDKESIKDAYKKSSELLKGHWRHFIKEQAIYYIKISMISTFVVMIFNVIPTLLENILHYGFESKRFFIIFFYLIGAFVSAVILALQSPILTMNLVRLFHSYKQNKPVYLQKKARKVMNFKNCFFFIFVVFTAFIFSIYIDINFDVLAPLEPSTQIISHRLGGSYAPENSLEGAKLAIMNHADGLETDIQRTKDGNYIIHHDNTFKRISGINQSASQLTSDEITQMSIHNTESYIPTLDSVLDASKDMAHLYLELKGSSADKKMVDDVVSKLKERDILEDCSLISLDYNLICYIEDTYPEIETGYLYYFYYGDVSSLNCDLLIMEEAMMSNQIVNEIHLANKKAFVWTVNTRDSAEKLLNSTVDGIITDKLMMVQEVQNEMSQRSDLERVMDYFTYSLSAK